MAKRSKPTCRSTDGMMMASQLTNEGQEGQNVCHSVCTEDPKSAENIQSLRDIEFYTSKIIAFSQSKKEQQTQKFFETTTNLRDHDKVHRRVVRSGHGLD